MGTCGDQQDPMETVAIEVAKIRRAYFWAEVRLYAKVLVPMAALAALAIWAIVEFM